MNFNTSKKRNLASTQTLFATLLSGLGMWITGGLWHNLILPAVNENRHPHHEGLGITLIAYFILAFLMCLLYLNASFDRTKLINGLKTGILVGVLWVFPHGLTMAATHDSSIAYEIRNTLYHIVEQGIGGILVYIVLKRLFS